MLCRVMPSILFFLCTTISFGVIKFVYNGKFSDRQGKWPSYSNLMDCYIIAPYYTGLRVQPGLYALDGYCWR